MRLTLVIDIVGTVAEVKQLVVDQDAKEDPFPIKIDSVDEFDVINMLLTYNQAPEYTVNDFHTEMKDIDL